MTAPGSHQICATALLCLAGVCAPVSAHALDLSFPATAELVRTTSAVEGQHPIATGPWTASALPTRDAIPTHDALGLVQEFTWQITGQNITTTSLLTTLRSQIEAQDFTVDFTCFAATCGGFDFRHGLPTGSAPEMYVDLGDFYYLSASSSVSSGDGDTHAALMISRGGATGFVHLALVQPASSAPVPVVQSTRAPDPLDDPAIAGDLTARLVAMGSAPLDDLRFQTGASELSGERYASLSALAAFLADDPAQRVVLVGHTDALGSLSGNIALSQARASAVRRYLTDELAVDPAQIEAQGIGFLAPRAPNSTAEGREANRRVEVVLANPG